MNLRLAIPAALAALFFCGSLQPASAIVRKHYRHGYHANGIPARTGTKKQTATGGPSGGSTKNATGGGS